jgi:NAD(P)-dependent dehydrogenase (short-subunit alcohol dehydrogenase family)/DNA-binding NarL/FixJ family response regulator
VLRLTEVIDVAAVDDHPIILDSVAGWVQTDEGDIRVIATAPTVSALLAGPGRRAAVVLLDLDLGDGSTAESNVAAIIAEGPAVLVLSASDQPSSVRAAMRAGARGYALKSDQADQIRSAIREVAAGRDWISARLALILATDNAADRPALSQQERRALQLYAAGLPMKSVAKSMSIGEETVKQYLTRVRRKYALAGRAAQSKLELYHRAVEDGHLPPTSLTCHPPPVREQETSVLGPHSLTRYFPLAARVMTPFPVSRPGPLVVRPRGTGGSRRRRPMGVRGLARYGSDMTIVNGAGVVVTGGGSGIGRAIARKLAADGARVVVNDLDQAAAHSVAVEIGGFAVQGDVGTDRGVTDLLDAAREFLGDVDIYCSNAGTVAGAGPETPDDLWQHAWEVNAMAHVRAARALLPGWLERGGGTFVVTASAAGLLTMLGAAPYSVTKHAAVGFAEWLAATYSHRGLTVHCVCPQGVRTQMLADSGRAGEIVLADAAIEPERVADALAAALAEGTFFVLPHPEVHDYYVRRATDTDRWLHGMSRLQRRIDSSAGSAESAGSTASAASTGETA